MRTGYSNFLWPEHSIDYLCIIKSAERFGLHRWDDEGQGALRQICTCAQVSILESQPQFKVLSHCEFGGVPVKASFW